MFLGQFRQMFAGGKEEEEPARVQKPPEQQKSSNSEEFIKTPEAQQFIGKWMTKKKDNGEPLYKKRGIVALMRMLFQVPGFSTNKEVLKASEEVLSMLGGMDGLQGFLMGWKVKSEGIIKGLKTIMGGK